MKPIELTEDQKNKLLEMCKELFVSSKPIINKNNFIRLWLLDSTAIEGEHCIKIHWFEFCMTYLIVKIRSLTQKGYPDNIKEIVSLYDFYWDTSNYDITKIHPVDYLYEQFLTIKK